ncbi:MAG: carbohydrate ABC transporter permease, partial [Candidatus Sumerlaeaceae bacterium]
MRKNRKNWQKLLWAGGIYALLLFIAVVMIFPFVWMVTTSFKTMEEAFRYPPMLFPEHWHFENYQLLRKTLPIERFFFNSVKITTLNVVGVLLSCSMGAFALARLRFPGRTLLFAAALITLMVPWQTTLIPVFIIFQKLGWKDSHYPLWVPAFFGGGFAVFFLRQFFLAIPRDLYEAALVDGLTPGGVLFRIYLP